jgi:hypothetical protein
MMLLAEGLAIIRRGILARGKLKFDLAQKNGMALQSIIQIESAPHAAGLIWPLINSPLQLRLNPNLGAVN